MIIVVIIFGLGIFALGLLGLSLFAGLSLGGSAIIAFALSFSSTVFAVKILEESGSMSSSHGKLAIGILIMQDLFAVIFLSVSSGKLPSPWALVLLSLLIIPFVLNRTPLGQIINRSGHDELLVLLGVLIPFGGAYLFGLVGLKPDLGALIMGIILAGHPKAKELSKAMLSFKDLFLVGFFLTIGLSGLPDLEAFGISILLTLALPVKILLFLLILTRLKLRARTATLTSFNLANYSEFGLIVGAAGVANGWISQEWMVIFALSLSLTFIIASPLNLKAQSLYSRWQSRLTRLETKERLPDDLPLDTGDAEFIIAGMGRTGTEVYNTLSQNHGMKVLGIDQDIEVVRKHLGENRRVLIGEFTDIEFWQKISPSHKIQMIILATSTHAVHMEVINLLSDMPQKPKIAALCRYNDEMEDLKKAGVDVALNLYVEAGAGYAEHIVKAYHQ